MRCIDENAVIKMLNTMDRYTSEELTLCDTDKTFPKNEVFIVDDVYEGLDELPTIEPEQRWIPVSERLPTNRDWYLGIFREPDTGWINPIPYVCDYVSAITSATTYEGWILHHCTDQDMPCEYYKELQCVAWMPLPEPWKEGENR